MAVQSVPDWLTADFLKSCLESDEEMSQKIVITRHTIEPAVPPGSNYGSLLFRATIDYKTREDQTKEHSISLIVKAPLTAVFIEELGIMDMYVRESKFYNEYIHETYKICKHNFVPKNYISPNPLCLVLEDLKESGFSMVDRHKLLDYEHCKLYIKASAKLHALSMAVHTKRPELVESLAKENPKAAESSKKFSKLMMKFGMKCMASYLEDKPEHKLFLDFIKEARESDTFDRIYENMEESKSSFNALIQVDPWCANMMFKYDSSGKVVGVKIFDFQGLKYTHPVKELLTFMWVSPQPEVRRTKLTDLLRLYYDSLNTALAEVDHPDRLSFEDMKAEVAALSPLVMLLVCTTLPLCLCDGIFDLNFFFSDNIFDLPIRETPFYKLYEGVNFQKHYPQLLKEVFSEGVLDYLNDKMKKQI